MAEVAELSMDQLRAGLDLVREAPADAGPLELIVVRPAENERRLVKDVELAEGGGVVDDMWSVRPSSKLGVPNPLAEVTVMSSRVARLIADSDEHLDWAQAGDQLYVDLDISEANMPPGTRISIGDEVMLEVTEEPHTGCGKFIRRFGVDAMKFVNSDEGRALRLRGVNTRVFTGGTARVGDAARKG